jgi:hypothetical protein
MEDGSDDLRAEFNNWGAYSDDGGVECVSNGEGFAGGGDMVRSVF